MRTNNICFRRELRKIFFLETISYLELWLKCTQQLIKSLIFKIDDLI